MKDVISDNQAAFIIAYRQTARSLPGTQPSTADQLGQARSYQTGTNNINSILDLIGAKVQVQTQGGNQGQGNPAGNAQTATIYESPFTIIPGDMNTYLPLLLAGTTVDASQEIVGRININQASKAVLMCIPGMTADIVEKIISQRTMDPKGADPSRLYPHLVALGGNRDP